MHIESLRASGGMLWVIIRCTSEVSCAHRFGVYEVIKLRGCDTLQSISALMSLNLNVMLGGTAWLGEVGTGSVAWGGVVFCFLSWSLTLSTS